MRKITKGPIPNELENWRRRFPNSSYPEMPEGVRQAVRSSCVSEQYGLCAYCCKPISADVNALTCHNEHVEAQRLAPRKTVDFSNIVASCNTNHQCGKAHGSQVLSLTPLMAECETEIRFGYSGRVEGQTERAKDSLAVLNLKSRVLNETRKRQIEALLFEGGCPPADIASLDEDTIAILLEGLSPHVGQPLQPYAPVLVNILKQELQKIRNR